MGVIALSNATSNLSPFAIFLLQWAAFLLGRFSSILASSSGSKAAMLVVKEVLQALVLLFVWFAIALIISKVEG